MDYELIIEIIAVITGLLSIWFSYKINILVYPVGMISLAIYIFIFLQNGLYANSIINFLYFIISIFGWWNWIRLKAKNEDKSEGLKSVSTSLQVSYLNTIERTITIIIAGISFYIATKFSDNINTLADYITGILGLGAMLLTAFKKVENWILYLVCDIILIPLCICNGLYLTSFQYLGYTILAVMGYISWSKEAKNHV